MELHVLTGGPCAGKSTTLQALNELGHSTVPEAARQIIEEQQRLQNPILPTTNFSAFQQLVFERQLALEKNITSAKPFHFLDRSIVDQIAFFELHNKKIPKYLLDAVQRNHYATIFYLESWPTYTNDAVRKETKEQSQKLHELHKHAYQKLGYNLVTIPVCQAQQRAQHILSYIQSNTNTTRK